MRKMLYIIGLPTVFSMIAFAGTWSGRLLDASCYDENKKADGCTATSGTKTFALDSMGKIFKLDAEGNAKASEALKNRADRSADPAKPQPKEVHAQVTGSEKDGTIAVESIDVK